MNNIPQDKQNIDNIPDDDHCFKCSGELEIIEDCDWDCDEGGCHMADSSYLKCVKCGQRNNWWEKEQWLKKKEGK